MRFAKTFLLSWCTIGGATASVPHRPKVAAGTSAAVNDGTITRAPMKAHSNSKTLNDARWKSQPRLQRNGKFAALLRHELRATHHAHSGEETTAHHESDSSSFLEQWKQAPGELPSDPWPLTVEYGVLLKKFHGVSFDEGGWRGDLIIATRWKDSRAGAVVPTGKTEVVLSSSDAAKKIWLPDIVITNLNFATPVEISSTITIDNKGTVTKVMRVIAKLISELDPKQFPFDTQTLKVRLASSTYMFDRLIMEPMKEPEYKGLSKHAFKGSDAAWSIDETVLQSMEETDGPLKKSRGEFIIIMTRNWQFFLTTVILPEFLLVVLAWTAFFFPLMPPFAMPKVASTMIPLLAMLAYMNRTSSMFPAKSSWLWICVYEEICTEMLVFAIIGNLATESSMYVFKNETLAPDIRSETRMLYVGIWCLLFSIAWGSRYIDDVASLALTIRGIYIMILVTYIINAMARNYGASQAREEAAVADAAPPQDADAKAEPPAETASDENPAEEAGATAVGTESDEKPKEQPDI